MYAKIKKKIVIMSFVTSTNIQNYCHRKFILWLKLKYRPFPP